MIYGDEESRQSRLSWSTVLSEGEKQLELEIIEKIQRVLLKENEQDMWIWSKNSYSVKEAYKLLLAEYETEDSRDQLIAWNELVPLKVSVLVWKLLQNKIPTKDNLVKRGILSESQTSCSFGRGKEETVSHVFFECTTVTEVCQEILRWLKINSTLHNTTLENYYQFSGLIANGRVRIERFSVIWFACIWASWKSRNEKTFQDKNKMLEARLEEIKWLSWKWLKSKAKCFNYAFDQWNLNPVSAWVLCLLSNRLCQIRSYFNMHLPILWSV
ncbi:hypothetical protein QL285_044442 [Trifolium repens]|nr:hypothetical protein QL285_044442 [Trifolium repens]